uniref:EGF-like domain-containing protein n=1 Tax=Trichuris muris TaxID=70415 RepID=A0A5S6R3B3_TRIMR
MNAVQLLLLKTTLAVSLFAIHSTFAQRNVKYHSRCPFEHALGKPNHLFGFERDNLCYTAVRRLNKENHEERDEETLNYSCEESFKGGKLFYLDHDVSWESPNWKPERPKFKILRSTSKNEWDAYMCVHEKYKNCIMAKKVACVYVKELQECHWEESVYIYQHEEQPYGRPCENKTEWSKMEGKCMCTNCMDTQWTQWTAHTDHRGFQVRTRYRPFSHTPSWSCTYDSSSCCHEIDTSTLGSGSPHTLAKRVGCAGGGTKRVRGNEWSCDCPVGLTGVFCEIDNDDCEDNDCANNSTCQDQRAAYKCICPPNTTGQRCEIPLVLSEEKKEPHLDIVPMILSMPLPGIIVGIMLFICALVAMKISAEKILSRRKKVQYAAELNEILKRKFLMPQLRDKQEGTKSATVGSESERSQVNARDEQQSIDLDSVDSSNSPKTMNGMGDEMLIDEIERSHTLSSDETSNITSKEQGFSKTQAKTASTMVSLLSESPAEDKHLNE